jgi:CTP:molybdopterin cytidylyltransferase MocA
LIGEHAELVAEVEMDDDAILIDIDTPEALDALRQRRKPVMEAVAKGGRRNAKRA